MTLRLWLRNAFLVTVLSFLSAPLIVVAGVSLNSQRSLIFPPQGLSLVWYTELFTRQEWLLPMGRSVAIALLASALAVSMALPLSYGVWRQGGSYVQALFWLGLAPAALPPVITAISYLSFWAAVGLYGQIQATLLSHAIFLLPLPLVLMSLGLRAIDPKVAEAAQTLGADEWTLFRTIALPLMRPYLLAGYAFAVVLSLNEYIISYMVSGFTVETLPIKIFNSLHYGYTPVMACVAVVFVGLAALIFGLLARFGNLLEMLGGRSHP